MAESIDRITAALADRYEIQREIGRGGMATVWLARDRRHERLVAIKVLKESLSHDVAADRFLAEIRIAAQLVHPHVLPVFDSGGDRDCLYYVMPFVDGETLRARLQRDGKLRTSEAIRIACEIGEALSYAHANGIVHRDIKPENILLAQGHAVLADFGVARALQQAGSDRITTIGLTVGTPLYMSPEQASGSPDVDGRSDIFSLGCVLYEMLSGEAPHASDSPPFVIAQKFSAVAPVSRSRPDTPPNVLRALEGALAIEREKRFATVDQFVETLSPRASRPARVEDLPRPKWRRMAVAAAVAAAAAAAAVTAVIVSSRNKDSVSSTAAARTRVAVFPFHATDASAAQWQEAIPDLLATALDGVPGITVSDPWSLWRNLRPDPQSHPRSPSPEEAVQFARAANASHFVLGSVSLLQREVQVSVRIYRGEATSAWQTFAASGPADSVNVLVRQIVVEAIRRLSVSESNTAALNERAGLTKSPDALKAWLSAREGRRRGQMDSANVAIDRAIALDSNFALALVDAASIKSWVSFMKGRPYDDMRGLVQRAVRLSAGASERTKLRAAGMLASLNTEGVAAATAMNGVLAIDSTDFDAWALLSYVQMVYGWQFGQKPSDAVASVERALRLDSTDASVLVQRAYLAFVGNDMTDIRRQVARLRLADTTKSIVRGALLSARALELDDRAFAERIDDFATASAPDWIAVLRLLRMYRPDRAELLLDRTRRPSSPLLRLAAGGTVQLAAAQGKWRALDSLRTARAFGGNELDRAIDRMFVAGAIGGAGDDQRARRSVATLSVGLPPDSAVALFGKRLVWHDGWLIGAFEAMYGDTAIARAWEQAMDKLPTKDAHPEHYTAALRDDIAARIALRRGDRANALVYARRAYDAWTDHTENQVEIMPEPAIRFQLAALLRASGAVDSARALFAGLTLPTTWMGFYTARASLELAELSEEARDIPSAQRYYLTATRMWERGDTSIGALRERAKRGALRVGEGSARF